MSERDDYDPRIDTVKNPGQFSAPWMNQACGQQATATSGTYCPPEEPCRTILDDLIDRQMDLVEELSDVTNLMNAIPEWVAHLPAGSVTEEELEGFL